MLGELMKILLLKATKMVTLWKVYPQEQLPIVFLFSESTSWILGMHSSWILVYFYKRGTISQWTFYFKNE